MKNQKGFTLIEMMIVLLVISVLLIITVPNIARHSSNINAKGCEGYMKMVEAQVQAYKIDNNNYKTPSFSELVLGGYLKSAEPECPDGTLIDITDEGVVKVNVTETTSTGE
ncbi:prepilin-type N-terminal cleavage/methylation domain-containing protein [Mesobacillus subterraneus]|uniref:competence type IV pilus major pilin ComGC n=1 Tax=Mesobacillus subterraneus TaxID=285983 RepID=UPI00203BD6D4|nr:competence type IV pilus major pilin ComGC [Mesobacillus subterraneus]MCM3571859.1 prepilin-type N-terminal cleavage/methylation domain-containing protein [Mesobacillus subterraneus]